nr:hypothetical protein CFP56_20723 [Quercus suber]
MLSLAYKHIPDPVCNSNGETGAAGRTRLQERHRHQHKHSQQQLQEKESWVNQSLCLHRLPFPLHIRWLPLLHSFQDSWALISNQHPHFLLPGNLYDIKISLQC